MTAALSEQDLAAARAGAAAGRPVTVWFTDGAVGVAPGSSARIVAVGDVEEGDFLQVRPAGGRDTLFCSPNELTRTRPSRTPARPPAEPTRPRARGSRTARRAAPAVAEQADAEPVPAPPPARARERGRAAPGRSAEVTITLTSTGDGEWTVDVATGAKRSVRPTPVPPADVAAAARSLPPVVGRAIAASLDAARRRQQERVERLRSELDAAQRTLDELEI